MDNEDRDNSCLLHIEPMPSDVFCKVRALREKNITCRQCGHGKQYIREKITINQTPHPGITGHPSLPGGEIKKEAKKMAVPEDRQCTEEGCEKYGVKDKLCYTHYKAKYGKAPYGKVSAKQTVPAVKKAAVKKPAKKAAAVKPPGNGSNGLEDIMSQLRDVAKAEVRPIVQKLFVAISEAVTELKGIAG